MKRLRILSCLICIIFQGIAVARVFMLAVYFPHIVELQDIKPAYTALVLGAGINPDGTPTAPLKDRLDAAYELLIHNKVQKLLLSGDNRTLSYNEPGVMQAYLRKLGVPDDAMVLDYAGRRTYDSCYRAKAIFGQSSLIVVTQRYHLPRALYLCKNLGIESQGYAADRADYLKRRYIYWNIREIGASLAAYRDIWLKPEPVLGEPLPIPQP
jgi:SanA protein